MSWDTVLVGAGAAGCVLAARLSEAGRRVLLLEAGPDFPDPEEMPPELRRAYGERGIWSRAFGYNTRFGWGYRARATDSHPDMYVPRGRLVGGSSAVNAQIFLRGVPEDYDGWAAAGNREWAWEKVLPCLKRIEADPDFDDDFHGADGPIPFTGSLTRTARRSRRRSTTSCATGASPTARTTTTRTPPASAPCH